MPLPRRPQESDRFSRPSDRTPLKSANASDISRVRQDSSRFDTADAACTASVPRSSRAAKARSRFGETIVSASTTTAASALVRSKAKARA